MIDMKKLHTRLLWLMAAALIVMGDIGSNAQTGQAAGQSAVPTTRSAAMVLKLTLPETKIMVGQTPWAFLTVKNVSNEIILFPQDRVHVEGEKGEPRTTLRQRQNTHRLQPGEAEVRSGGYEPPIEPGQSSTRKYDLAQLYDLSKPGKYSVYVEVLDRHSSKGPAVWLRSPAAQLDVTAAK